MRTRIAAVAKKLVACGLWLAAAASVAACGSDSSASRSDAAPDRAPRPGASAGADFTKRASELCLGAGVPRLIGARASGDPRAYAVQSLPAAVAVAEGLGRAQPPRERAPTVQNLVAAYEALRAGYQQTASTGRDRNKRLAGLERQAAAAAQAAALPACTPPGAGR